MALYITHHAAYGAVGVRGLCQTCGAFSQYFFEHLAPMFGVKPSVRHALDTHQSRELLRTFTHQQHMLGALHDQARQGDRIPDCAHSCDGTAAQGRTIHDGGV